MGKARHTHLGITHGGRVIPINRTEVALTVDQDMAHREVLRHTYDSVVYRAITVRMVFTDDIADDTRRLLVRFIPIITQFMHGKQHTPVNRFKAIPHIWKRAADNDAHRIVEIRLFKLVFNIDGQDFSGDVTHESQILCTALALRELKALVNTALKLP